VSELPPIRIKLAHPIIEDEERTAVLAALESGQLAQGPRVAAFEAAFAEYIGVRHAVAVNSGTAALHVALLAHGIGAGDDVIVPAFSFAATPNAVLHAGARPVFVDVLDDDFGIDATRIEAAITPATKAIIAVHLYGQPCDIDAVRAVCSARNLVLIEDAAQAVGATLGGVKAGAFGTGAFSLYATKNLQTGEGGMITTDDHAVAERARMFRSQGERTRYVTDELGYNYRMTEVAAALGSAQLPKLEGWNERRRVNARRLSGALGAHDQQQTANGKGDVGSLVLPEVMSGRTHVFHQYTVRVAGGRETRDGLQAHLRGRGIEAGVFYPAAIHRQPLYRRLGYGDIELPVAQRLADTVLSLPVHPSLSEADVDEVAAAVLEFFGRG
jgi:dTDP-4-amino-4,6-dideoxygalactose transaminase